MFDPNRLPDCPSGEGRSLGRNGGRHHTASVSREGSVLKGGTVLNLCFGPPKRLSVDLDYNYIGNLEREKMLKDRSHVEEAIYELSRRRGYQPQRSADSFDQVCGV